MPDVAGLHLGEGLHQERLEPAVAGRAGQANRGEGLGKLLGEEREGHGVAFRVCCPLLPRVAAELL